MGKSLIGILEVGALIGLQFIPGIGQAVAGVVGSIGLGTITAAQGLAVASLALVAGETLLNSILQKSPKPQAMEATIKSPTPPRVSVYGVNRLYGAYILYVTDANGNAVDVWAYHDGQMDSVIQYFIGDRRVQVVGGVVQALDDKTFENGHVIAGSNLGLPTETAFAEVISHVPDQWTSAHRGDGVVTGYMISDPVKSKNFSTIYSTGGPNATPMSIAGKWQLVFDWRDEMQSASDPTTWKWSENAVLHLAHYLLVRMRRDWTKHFLPTIDYWTDAANDADVEMTLNSVQTIMAVKADGGDSSIRVYDTNGLAAGMSIDIYVSGNNANTETKTVTSISGNTIHFSGSLSHKHPQGSQVTWTSAPDHPATEPRYRSCVAHQHTDAHKDVLAHLLACFDGWLSPRSDGALVVYSGRYTAPTIDPLGPDEIVSYSLQEGVNEEDAVNSIKVSYVSANHDYNTVQCDDWTDEDDIEARGKVLADSLDNQVPSFAQARRLAKRAMAKINAPRRGTITTTSSGRRIIGQRFVPVQLIESGTTFFTGVVEVQKITRNLQTGGVTFDWIAVDPNIDEWNPVTEEGLPAPVGNRIAQEPLDAPTITHASASLSDNSAAGTPGVRLSLTVEGLDRDDVTWFARTRTVGAAVWDEASYTDVDPGASVLLVTGFVAADTSVEAEVAYQTGDGRISPYSDTSTVDTSTAALAPDTVSSFAATGGVGTISESWTNPTSANYSLTRLYRGTSATFSSATAIADIPGSRGAPGSYGPATGITAGTYYEWAIAVSTTGVESSPAGPQTVTVT